MAERSGSTHTNANYTVSVVYVCGYDIVACDRCVTNGASVSISISIDNRSVDRDG